MPQTHSRPQAGINQVLVNKRVTVQNTTGSDATRKQITRKFNFMKKWYVARSKPRNEELLWRQLCLRHIESYYPYINVPTVNPRARKVQPYFPGYLFVYVDLGLIGKSTFEWMPGGIGLVSFGNEPAFVPDNLICAIKRQIENLKMVSEKNPVPLCKGDKVAIHAGLFTGYEGIFNIQLSGTDRVQVLLSLLDNQLIPVEMPANYIHFI
jgi:transcription antitermination factor NusG